MKVLQIIIRAKALAEGITIMEACERMAPEVIAAPAVIAAVLRHELDDHAADELLARTVKNLREMRETKAATN